MNDNPYEAPSANLLDHSAGSESVSIREAHIKHEASIKSIGILYYIGGATMLLAAPGLLLISNETGMGFDELSGVGVSVLYAILGVISLIVGRGVRTLRRWVKVPVAILSGLGMLSIPIGTLINGYILYLIFSEKGKTVLSDDYKKIIKLTPEIRYKTPKWVWVLAFILIAFITLAVYFAVSGGALH